MFLSHDLHRSTSALAPFVLLAAVALPQDPVTPRVVPLPTAAVQDPKPDAQTDPQAGEPQPCERHVALVGRAVHSSVERDDRGQPVRIGRIADFVVDLQNATVPHVVVTVEGGETTTFPWQNGAWNAEQRDYLVAVTQEEARSMSGIPPDLAQLGLDPKGLGKDAKADSGDATKGAAAAEASAPAPLPRYWLASQIASSDAFGRDGRFGAIDGLYVDLTRGECRYLSVVTMGTEAEARPERHILPLCILRASRDENRRVQLQLDRSLALLRETPVIDAKDKALHDEEFRAKIWTAVGMTPPPHDRG
jgi:hypothetical protein